MHKNDFIYSLSELIDYLKSKNVDITKTGLLNLRHTKFDFSLLVSKYYLGLVDWSDKDDPLRKMAIPDIREKMIRDYELADPIGDKLHSFIDGIIHRYSDRCLLNLTSACAIHCRFCFRKCLLGQNNVKVTECFNYIKKHAEIWEVILSGGDPFMLPDSYLYKIICNLKRINQVKIIRFHTRVPAVYPNRITDKLIGILTNINSLIIVFHINHYREITPDFIRVVKKLRQTNAILLSQSVLLKGINDNIYTLSKLFRGLVETGIKPYYLHHPDLVKGTSYFRVSISHGKQLFKQLRKSISGVCLPEYILELPGGKGKMPVFWLPDSDNNTYFISGKPKLKK